MKILRRERVVLESPYSGAVKKHTFYARRALFDSLSKNEAPIASHLLHTQVLADANPDERDWGMAAGWAWIEVADRVVCYVDYGISNGMRRAIQQAEVLGIPVEMRSIGQNPAGAGYRPEEQE